MTPEEEEAQAMLAAALRDQQVRAAQQQNDADYLEGFGGAYTGLGGPIGSQRAAQMAQQGQGLRRHNDMGLLEALARRRNAYQKTPEELDAMAARATLDRAKAAKYGRPKTAPGADPMLHLDGFELDPAFSLKPEVAEKLRGTQGDTRLMLQNLDEMMGLYKTYGNKVLPGPVRARMSSLARHLQLAAKGKSMFELGVLAGPDLGLLESTIPDPTNKNATIADFFGGGTDAGESMERFRVMREQAAKRFDEAVGSRGYRKGRKAGPVNLDAGGTAAKPPEEDPDALQKQLEELEANIAAAKKAPK